VLRLNACTKLTIIVQCTAHYSYYYRDVDKLKAFGARNRETLAQLLLDFMRVFAHQFDFRHSVLCMRLGRCVTKYDKEWLESVGRDRR
jgi:DNA polymerase sigma